MSKHSERTERGAWSTIALLDAMNRNDPHAAQLVIDTCDPGPTLFTLSSAWVAMVRAHGLDAEALLESMRSGLEEKS